MQIKIRHKVNIEEWLKELFRLKQIGELASTMLKERGITLGESQMRGSSGEAMNTESKEEKLRSKATT